MTTLLTGTEWLSLLTFATAMSFTPGPNTTVSTVIGAQRGWRAALPFILGVTLGWSLLLVACVWGLGAFLQAWPEAQRVLTLLGTALMLWLAWRLAGVRQLQAVTSRPEDELPGLATGLLMQAVNIKAWLLGMTLSASWITVHPQWGWRLMSVLPVMAAFAFSSNLSYAWIGAGLRQWLAQGARLVVFNRAMAGVLTLTAAWVGFQHA
jgi:threonine/homoserine/homoserine lactone efflux protein